MFIYLYTQSQRQRFASTLESNRLTVSREEIRWREKYSLFFLGGGGVCPCRTHHSTCQVRLTSCCTVKMSCSSSAPVHARAFTVRQSDHHGKCRYCFLQSRQRPPRMLCFMWDVRGVFSQLVWLCQFHWVSEAEKKELCVLLPKIVKGAPWAKKKTKIFFYLEKVKLVVASQNTSKITEQNNLYCHMLSYIWQYLLVDFASYSFSSCRNGMKNIRNKLCENELWWLLLSCACNGRESSDSAFIFQK